MLKKFAADLRAEFCGYNKSKLTKDLLAGLTVTAVALPLALAFGVGSGASASAGLITAILAGLLIGAFAGGSYQISGPTGAMTAILVPLALKYGLNGIWIAGALSGIFLIAAGFLKFGRVVSFIPAPVVTGFTSGIALIIAVGQLDNFLGVSTPAAESSALKLVGYFRADFSVNLFAMLAAAIVIAVMLIWPKRLGAVFPSSLAGLIIASAAATALKLPLETIGAIPKALLSPERLRLGDLSLEALRPMLMPALSIAALGMIESLLCGEVGSKMKREAYNANRDLVSQGLGNLIIPFFGGVPATAAIARTSVGVKSGGQTRLVSIFHALGLILSMLLLSPLMSQIPLCALSGVLIVTAWRMNEWDSIKLIFKNRFKSEIAMFLLTMTATVVFDLTEAIILGVLFALVLFVAKISNMNVFVREVDTARIPGEKINADLSRVRVVYLTGPLFFATVEKLKHELAAVGDMDAVILSMRGVILMDFTGLGALEALRGQLKQNGCKLALCALQPDVEKFLRRSSFLDSLGPNSLFWSADLAIRAIAP